MNVHDRNRRAGPRIRSKIIQLVLAGITTVSSCGTPTSSARTTIRILDSVLIAGDTFHAEIHVLDTAYRFQRFFVVEDHDTFRLPVTRDGKVGLLDMFCKNPGPRAIHGFTRIEYANPDSVAIERFDMNFTVK
jgi:hypothetical protein